MVSATTLVSVSKIGRHKIVASRPKDNYGYIEKIIELNYNDQQTVRSVVLFKCYWYDQAKKGKNPDVMDISHPSILKLSGTRKNLMFWHLKLQRYSS